MAEGIEMSSLEQKHQNKDKDTKDAVLALETGKFIYWNLPCGLVLCISA